MSPLTPASCHRCDHLRRPGTAKGCAAGRNDLAPLFSTGHPLRRLPGDNGKSCCHWKPHPAFVESFEERAAILEFDAGLPRREAEAAALCMTEIRPSQDRPQTDDLLPIQKKEPIMSLTISENSATSYQLAPAGTWIARCFRVIDLGEQPTEYKGQTKMQPKLMLSWELLDDETQRDDGGPMTIHKRFTASLHEKSALRKTLESWRGKAFTPEELNAFNVSKLAGAYALIAVVHNEKDGKTYANISSIMKPPKGMTPPPGVNDVLLFDMADPTTHDNLMALPDKLREQIEASPSWSATKQPAAKQAGGESGFDDLEDVAF
jgi:hypothetical protein